MEASSPASGAGGAPPRPRCLLGRGYPPRSLVFLALRERIFELPMDQADGRSRGPSRLPGRVACLTVVVASPCAGWSLRRRARCTGRDRCRGEPRASARGVGGNSGGNILDGATVAAEESIGYPKSSIPPAPLSTLPTMTEEVRKPRPIQAARPSRAVSEGAQRRRNECRRLRHLRRDRLRGPHRVHRDRHRREPRRARVRDGTRRSDPRHQPRARSGRRPRRGVEPGRPRVQGLQPARAALPNRRRAVIRAVA